MQDRRPIARSVTRLLAAAFLVGATAPALADEDAERAFEFDIVRFGEFLRESIVVMTGEQRSADRARQAEIAVIAAEFEQIRQRADKWQLGKTRAAQIARYCKQVEAGTVSYGEELPTATAAAETCWVVHRQAAKAVTGG